MPSENQQQRFSLAFPGSYHLHRSLGANEWSEMGWGCLLKQETTGCRCELSVSMANTTGFSSPAPPRAAGSSGQQWSRCCHICLLGWAFCRASGNKGGRKDPVLETHRQDLLRPPAAAPPLGTPQPPTLRKGRGLLFQVRASGAPPSAWLQGV